MYKNLKLTRSDLIIVERNPFHGTFHIGLMALNYSLFFFFSFFLPISCGYYAIMPTRLPSHKRSFKTDI